MGYFENFNDRLELLTQMLLRNNCTKFLHRCGNYLLLVALALCQLSNAYKSENDKGINHAVLAGAILYLLKNIALAEDKSSFLYFVFIKNLQEEMRELNCTPQAAKIQLPTKMGRLTSIIRILIRVDLYVTWRFTGALFDILKCIAADRTLPLITFVPAFVLICLLILTLVIFSTIVHVIVGISYVPAFLVLVLIDMLSVELVEAAFVVFAEKVQFMPDLAGKRWAYISVTLVTLAIASFTFHNVLAALAWFRDYRLLMQDQHFSYEWKTIFGHMRSMPSDDTPEIHQIFSDGSLTGSRNCFPPRLSSRQAEWTSYCRMAFEEYGSKDSWYSLNRNPAVAHIDRERIARWWSEVTHVFGLFWIRVSGQNSDILELHGGTDSRNAAARQNI